MSNFNQYHSLFKLSADNFIGIRAQKLVVYEPCVDAKIAFEGLSKEQCAQLDLLIKELDVLAAKRSEKMMNASTQPLIKISEESLAFFKTLPEEIQKNLHSNYLIAGAK